MSVVSMTGFARARGGHGTLDWTWELKSVNGKGLEMRFRLPPGFDAVEVQARQALQARLKRGSVQVTLSLAEQAQAPNLKINREALQAISEAIRAMENIMPMQPPSADGIFRIKGVIEEGEAESPDIEARDAALIATLNQAIEALAKARGEEGERIGAVLQGQLQRIAELTAEARSLASLAPEAVRQRLDGAIARFISAHHPHLAPDAARTAARSLRLCAQALSDGWAEAPFVAEAECRRLLTALFASLGTSGAPALAPL